MPSRVSFARSAAEGVLLGVLTSAVLLLVYSLPFLLDSYLVGNWGESLEPLRAALCGAVVAASWVLVRCRRPGAAVFRPLMGVLTLTLALLYLLVTAVQSAVAVVSGAAEADSLAGAQFLISYFGVDLPCTGLFMCLVILLLARLPLPARQLRCVVPLAFVVGALHVGLFWMSFAAFGLFGRGGELTWQTVLNVIVLGGLVGIFFSAAMLVAQLLKPQAGKGALTLAYVLLLVAGCAALFGAQDLSVALTRVLNDVAGYQPGYSTPPSIWFHASIMFGAPLLAVTGAPAALIGQLVVANQRKAAARQKAAATAS